MKEEDFEYEQKERGLLEEHNKIRSNPQSYIPKLQKWLTKFRDNTLYLVDENPLQTFEGKRAVQEAISFLSNQKSLAGLEYSKELSEAAEEHVKDIGKNGLTTHEGSNGNNVSDRIEKYIEWEHICAESLDFGFTNPENIIINLLVDDGVKERNQRRNMFSEDFKYLGISMGSHRDCGVCVCFVYAGDVREIGSAPDNEINYIRRYIENTLYRKETNNSFQEEDPDAPDDTIAVKIEKIEKVYNGVKRKITKKIYTLKDKTKHIVEVEEN